MGFSKVLFSKVHGVVLNHGKPVEGAEVTRFFNFGWTNEEQTESVKTDKNGEFNFPIITRFSLMTSIMPHEPVISQHIVIHHGGKEHVAWFFSKHNYEENGELKGRPIDLVCELTREPDQDDKTNVYGISRIK